ncbi:MAG: aminopeptidase [Bdellovibrionales bacterium]|nr:aminopeptidase [Bdellovibrionales bacterium]
MKFLVLICFLFFLPGCMVGYFFKSSYHQQKLLRSRVAISEVLEDEKTPLEVKTKLQLAMNAKFFAEKELGLNKSKNYSSYVSLERPYVTWIVRASKAFELEAYQWWFPIVGHVPYKGYFSESEAQEEATTFDKKKYDIYVRGVTAYSTLGWFDDPITSPMLRYNDHDLVELIIHESVHATLYIKSNAEFNERLATFLGQEGAKLFYQKLEGQDSQNLKAINDNIEDTKLFSNFISKELEDLRKWYVSLPDTNKNVVEKYKRIKNIQIRFAANIKPLLKTESFKNFDQRELNNAMLLSYETYIQDLSDFEKLFQLENKNLKNFLNRIKSLEEVDNPQDQLKAWIALNTH